MGDTEAMREALEHARRVLLRVAHADGALHGDAWAALWHADAALASTEAPEPCNWCGGLGAHDEHGGPRPLGTACCTPCRHCQLASTEAPEPNDDELLRALEDAIVAAAADLAPVGERVPEGVPSDALTVDNITAAVRRARITEDRVVPFGWKVEWRQRWEPNEGEDFTVSVGHWIDYPALVPDTPHEGEPE